MIQHLAKMLLVDINGVLAISGLYHLNSFTFQNIAPITILRLGPLSRREMTTADENEKILNIIR